MPLHQRLGLEGSARASFALYNQTDDIDRLVEALLALIPAAKASGTNSASNSASAQQRTPPADSLHAGLLALRHGKARYALLMKAAQQQPQNAELRQDRFLLHGCTSRVWLDHSYQVDSNQLRFQIDSDTRIIKGLGLLLVELLDGRTPAQVLGFEIKPLLQQLGLDSQLSESRSNGLRGDHRSDP